MASTRFNALDQALDIAGSLVAVDSMTISEEPLGLGARVSNGTGAGIGAQAAGISTVTGLTGFTANSVGNFLTIADGYTNAGTYLITEYVDATSVKIAAPSATTETDAIWVQRAAYSLQDDINYERSDRKLIKGTTNYFDAVPTFVRPTAIGTNVPVNLTTLAGKSTDAQGFVMNRIFRGVAAVTGNAFSTLTSAGNLKHSDAVDKTGVPCWGVAPYATDTAATYVLITDPENDNTIQIVGGPNDGYTVYGRTRAGSGTSPDSVEVEFMAVPHGNDLTNGVAVNWDATWPTPVDMTYGYFQRLDQLAEDSFRKVMVLGLVSDSDLRSDVDQLQTVMGSLDGDTSLAGHLTNVTAYFPFYNLPDATPSVVEAFNTLNAQIGDRTFTGVTLTSGQTVAASLQALSDAIVGSQITRLVERAAAVIPANTAHTLPGSMTYTIDGTNNGANLWVFSRGLLRTPGSVANGDDYAEDSTTSVKFFSAIKKGDILNFFKRA
jgi:hypothetical protein